MANFDALTACNTPKCKDGVAEMLEKILERYDVPGEITVYVEDGYLHFYGYNWPSACKVKPDDDPEWDDSDCLDDFLRELAPLLEETLIVHPIGNEKCRFPLAASCWVVHPDGRFIYHDLPWDVRSPECGEAAA